MTSIVDTRVKGRGSGRVLVVLGALVALGPLATDAYVPALPQLAASLDSDVGAAQLSVTATLLGLGVGQLIAGPWSDTAGRRRPIMVGAGLYVVGAVVSALAASMPVLLGGRLLQGLGGAFTLVVAYAYVRDRFTGSASVRTFAALLLVAGSGPVIAPLAGAFIAVLAGWRAVFVTLGVAGVLAGTAAAVALPETRLRVPRAPATDARAREPSRLVGTIYWRLVQERPFMAVVGVNATVFGAMFAYIAASPFVLQQQYGLSVTAYSVVFAANAFGLVVAAQAGGRLAKRVRPRRLLAGGVTTLLVGAGTVLLAAFVVSSVLWVMLAGMFVLVSSVGMVLPNAATLALQDHAQDSGAASALLGAGQYVVGALAALVVGLVTGTFAPAVAMSIVIAALALTAAATGGLRSALAA